MIIMIVNVHVKPGLEETFKEASIKNASNSVKEPGVIRFDLIQQITDPTRFALVEIYKDAAAQASHRESAHYLAWREVAEPMMAEPRTRAEYSPIFPTEPDWLSHAF